jgi:phosphatidate phosphatase PAH1
MAGDSPPLSVKDKSDETGTSPESTTKSSKKNKRRPNRRRRNKKDVILDLTKRRRGAANRTDPLEAQEQQQQKQQKPASVAVKRRKFETMGQYMRRIDRMVAIAKVEANLESRFDITLPRKANN